MPLTRIKQKGQVTIPAAIRRAMSLEEGDIVEVTNKGGTIVLTPKAVVDRDAVTDAAIDEGLEDLAHGRVTPAFSDAGSLLAHLDHAGDED